ncbi:MULTISPECIES: FG-GAP repeat domain-containing protein [unclassified Streptomyces]|uniref:FG-GAP repeat domain-containing protein n=1 Tax=unclassified Streptomyces TaxID=2593676 RepID=UPI002E81510A|nr:VCBS repeat-containing protein [Streptomyces sp. NBC_00523]WUD00574.1 FG-GAP-like repeat-containing protein [Streptomyces sp. NBC_00523]
MPARSKRARRLAACTALVLSAGMLLAAPASADDTAPAPHRATQPRVPAADAQPTLTLPAPTAKKKSRAAQAEGAKAAVVPALPRFDVDGDGYSDTLYRGIDGHYYLIPTNGSDSYEFFVTTGDYEERLKDVITPGDLNGDGKPELLTLSATGTLSIHQVLGTSDTGYADWSGTGWQKYNKVVAAGDLTGDGRGDLLARTPSGDIYLYAATGNVSGAPFKAGVKVGYGWGSYDQIVGANDVNGDGIGDLYTRTPAGDLYYYAGTGKAASPYKARVKVGYGFDTYNQIIATDDFTGDGLGDLMARTPGGTLYFYESTGYGTFLKRSEGGTGWNVASLFTGQGGNPDFGKNELMARTKGGTLYWYYAKNNGKLSARIQASDSGGWAGATINFPSSLDNDGMADLMESYNGTLYNEGSDLGGGWSGYTAIVGPGDLNGDGKGDLLGRTKAGDLYLFKGNGLGTKLASRIKVGYGFNTYNKIVGAGDLSGDGIADVVARDTKGNLYLYKGTGSATKPLKARVKLGYGYNTYKQFAAPGDLDGDGKADLVGVDGKGDVYRYSSTGTGKINKRVKIGYGWDIYNGLY